MSDEELQRRRAARLREQIAETEQGLKSPESSAEAKQQSGEKESTDSHRPTPSAKLSPREFIHRRMRELDSEEEKPPKS
jgi:hypothetical protein